MLRAVAENQIIDFSPNLIIIYGTKREGWKVSFQTKGLTSIDNYFFNIEDAIVSGEVKSKGMTSDKALSDLKKAKDKLDLELITQDEYDKIKKDLPFRHIQLKLNFCLPGASQLLHPKEMCLNAALNQIALHLLITNQL